MNCALRRRKSTDSASITTTRLRTERIGWRNAITPMPPATATAAATKKTAMAKSSWSLPRSRGSTRRSRGMGRCGMQPRLDIWRKRLQQLLLGVDELFATRIRQLVLGTQHDRLHRARVLAVAAEDAPQHVDLVRLRVALAGRNAILVGVLGRDDEDASDRAGRRAELAADAPLETVLVAAQVVAAPVPLGSRALVFRIFERDRGREELAERRLQPRREGRDVGGDARPLALGVWRDAFVRPAQRRRLVGLAVHFLLLAWHQLPLRRHQDDP